MGALVTRIRIAVFFTILILTGNTVAHSIRERVPELAILKTLGFSNAAVTALVLGETTLLFVIGAGLGMLAAVSMLPVLNGATGGAFPPPFLGMAPPLPAARPAVLRPTRGGPPAAHRGPPLPLVERAAGHAVF